MILDEEIMSIDELRELREKELYLEMGKIKPDDPVYDKYITRAKVFSDIRCNELSTDNNKYNNNARNDIEEQKLLLEQRKIKADGWHIAIELGKALGYAVVGYFCVKKSYTMAEVSAPFKDMKKFGEDLLEKVHRR